MVNEHPQPICHKKPWPTACRCPPTHPRIKATPQRLGGAAVPLPEWRHRRAPGSLLLATIVRHLAHLLAARPRRNELWPSALTLTNSRSRTAQAKVFQHQLVIVQGQKHEDDQPLRPKSKSSLRTVMVATAALS